jgi:phosphohistidine phosphatase
MPNQTRHLILLRHAKAEPAGGGSDEIRALAPRGRRQCASVGARLAASGLLPELVLVSSAVRTTQTWEGVAAALGDVPDAEVVVSDAVYQARMVDVVNLVREVDDRVRTLLVVGHEPAMSATAAFLAGTGEPGHLAQVRTGLSTGAFAVLASPGWATAEQGAWAIRDVVRPEW